MPRIEVTAKNNSTGIVTKRATNETGTYEFPSLQPGPYTLSTGTSGFQTATFNNVELGQGQQVRLNFSLQVIAAGQTVEVVAEADTQLATTTASVGGVLNLREIQSLALGTRNVLDLVTLMPGVVTNCVSASATTSTV